MHENSVFNTITVYYYLFTFYINKEHSTSGSFQNIMPFDSVKYMSTRSAIFAKPHFVKFARDESIAATLCVKTLQISFYLSINNLQKDFNSIFMPILI